MGELLSLDDFGLKIDSNEGCLEEGQTKTTSVTADPWIDNRSLCDQR